MIKTYKPTSAGMRFRKTLIKGVEFVRPEKSLTLHIKGNKGRSDGSVVTRHKEVGSKKLYRIIDFKRDKKEIPAVVSSIQDDPNRGPNIALLTYKDGEKRYILAPEGLKVGDTVIATTKQAEFTPGNTMPLENIPLGMQIHNIELNIGAGGAIARGAGNSAQILAKEGSYVNVKLPSGEVKKILGACSATIGTLSNMDLRNTDLGKAGRNRHKGVRPTVRGVAMPDPGKHPHAGSYKHSGIGLPSPKTPWGQKAKGVKTRRRKHTNYTIVTSRHNAKKRNK